MADLISRSGVGGPPALAHCDRGGRQAPFHRGGRQAPFRWANALMVAGLVSAPGTARSRTSTPKALQPAFMIMAIWPMGVAEQIRIQPHRPGFMITDTFPRIEQKCP